MNASTDTQACWRVTLIDPSGRQAQRECYAQDAGHASAKTLSCFAPIDQMRVLSCARLEDGFWSPEVALTEVERTAFVEERARFLSKHEITDTRNNAYSDQKSHRI